MPTVLLITGTCGVGKSTTARAWATERHCAHINVDEVRNWIRDKATRRANDYQKSAVTEIAATAAESFVRLGLDVALDYVWMPDMLRAVAARLAPIADVKMVWLRCDRSENRRRDAERPANVVMADRVDELLAELNALANWPAELTTIDSTHLSVQGVLDRLA